MPAPSPLSPLAAALDNALDDLATAKAELADAQGANGEAQAALTAAEAEVLSKRAALDEAIASRL